MSLSTLMVVSVVFVCLSTVIRVSVVYVNLDCGTSCVCVNCDDGPS